MIERYRRGDKEYSFGRQLIGPISKGDLFQFIDDWRRGYHRSISFILIGGLLFFHEVNGRKKLPAVLGVMLGIVLTVLG